MDRIVIASAGTKLMYHNGGRATLVQLLAKIGALLGASADKLPQGESLEVFLNHAFTNWYGFTPEEIEMAVVCNIERKNNEFVPFFGTISVQYIADCLHHFSETKRKAIARSKALAASQRPPDVVIDEKEQFDFIKNWYSEKREFPFADYYHAFEYAWKTGMFKGYDLEKWMQERKDKIIAEICASKKIGADIKERQEVDRMFSGESIRGRLRTDAVKMLIKDLAQCQ